MPISRHPKSYYKISTLTNHSYTMVAPHTTILRPESRRISSKKNNKKIFNFNKKMSPKSKKLSRRPNKSADATQWVPVPGKMNPEDHGIAHVVIDLTKYGLYSCNSMKKSHRNIINPKKTSTMAKKHRRRHRKTTKNPKIAKNWNVHRIDLLLSKIIRLNNVIKHLHKKSKIDDIIFQKVAQINQQQLSLIAELTHDIPKTHSSTNFKNRKVGTGIRRLLDKKNLHVTRFKSTNSIIEKMVKKSSSTRSQGTTVTVEKITTLIRRKNQVKRKSQKNMAKKVI